VLRAVDAEPLETPQVEVLDVLGRGLQDHLELEVLSETEGVLAVAAVRRTSGGLDVGATPGIRAQDREKRRRVHGPRSHGLVVRKLEQATLLPPEGGKFRDQSLQREHSGTV
jgi:hypothetical protein